MHRQADLHQVAEKDTEAVPGVPWEQPADS